MRSRCRRSIITMSAPARPRRMSVKTATPIRSSPGGSRVEGPMTRTSRAQRGQQQDVGAGHPRMQDVAADGDDEAADPARLRRMVSASSSACVGCSCAPSPALIDRAVDLAGEEVHRAGGMVAHHDQVGPHGVERHRRVDQRLALLDGGGGHGHVHDVGAQPLAGQLERRLGAGGSLEEEVDLRPPPQRALLLLDLSGHVDGGVGQVEQRLDVPRRQSLDAEEMAVREHGVEGSVAHAAGIGENGDGGNAGMMAWMDAQRLRGCHPVRGAARSGAPQTRARTTTDGVPGSRLSASLRPG